MMRAVAIVAFVAFAAACGAEATPTPAPTPTPSLRQVAVGLQFTLDVGEQVEVSGHQALLTFDGVTGDSRCPIDVVCVRAGEAVVSFAWRDSGSTVTAFQLRHGEGRDTTRQFGTLTLQLTGVQPAPVSTTPIPPDAYQVTIRLAGS